MSWPDLMTPWNAEPALPLRAVAAAIAAGRFCADCLKAGQRCPDHHLPTGD